MNSRLKRELRRQLRDFKYETGLGVIRFQNGLVAAGAFTFSVNGGPEVVTPNLVVEEGRNHMLNVELGGTVKIPTWYLAPFAGNVTPADNWTAANFAANSTEFTNYAETSRQEFTSNTATASVISNLAARAEITVGAGPQTTIWGAGLISSATKSGTSGVLFSASRLSNARDNLQENDVIAIGYSFTLADAGP